jgi:hypothetical protein
MSTRPPERDDLEALLDPLLDFAKDMLRKSGEFFPFGAVMTTDGDVRLVGADSGSEQPPSQELIDLLVQGMRSQAASGDIKAAGICFDGLVRGQDGTATDAVVVSLEHRAGDSVKTYLPYSKGRFTGLNFGDLSAGPGDHQIFVAS